MAEKYCSPVFKCGEDLDKALAAALCSCDDAARAEAAAKALEQLVDDEGKIKAEALPEEWVREYVEEYIDEALGGEY
jgi:hypothetical protein